MEEFVTLSINENDLTLALNGRARAEANPKHVDSTVLSPSGAVSVEQDTLQVSSTAMHLAAQETRRAENSGVIQSEEEAQSFADLIAKSIAGDGQKALAAFANPLSKELVNLL